MLKTTSLSRTDFYTLLIGALVLIALFLTSLYSYLLFHTLAELFSIIVVGSIFLVFWNSRQYLDNSYLLFLAIAYAFVAGIDLLHTLAYRGMGVFSGYDANLPTQLWIAARYLESISLVLAALFAGRRLKTQNVFLGFVMVTTLLLLTIFVLRVFPDCYIEGQGLTPFKIVSEYVIIVLFGIGLALLYRIRERFDQRVYSLLAASIVVTIFAELSFTLYISVYGFANLVGHFFKIISFYLIYKALVEASLRQPYATLFRDLKASQEALRISLQEKELLLREIHHRVKNNLALVSNLLAIQAQGTEDPRLEMIIAESQYRIQAMAQIHEHLYQSTNLGSINMQDYVSRLIMILQDSLGHQDISLRVCADDVTLHVDQAIPCGLIINELVTNSFKHAFPRQASKASSGSDSNGGRADDARIDVSLEHSENRITVGVRDNGVGMPHYLNIKHGNSLGLTLVDMLTRQLGGVWVINNTVGTSVTITFPYSKEG